jgi:hypothetical protein
MNIAEDMNLDALAERMGDATEIEARIMRAALVREFPELDTADVPESAWLGMLEHAALLGALATLSERDDAGRHFTETTAARILDRLEALDWIEIRRPIHEPTGIPYGSEHWHLTVTDAGIAAVSAWLS